MRQAHEGVTKLKWIGRKLARCAMACAALVLRPLTLGVRAAIFDAEGRVCLVRHGYMPGWYMPGGGVEPGEDVLTAMIREVREEVALAVRGRPVLHGIFRATRRDHVLIYVVREFERLGQRPPDREIAESGFFPVDALPAATTRATRARLAEIASGAEPAARW